MYERLSDKIFRKNGKDRSASGTYCKALSKMVLSCKAWYDYVMQYCREGHFHPHGTRKGAATHVTTSTMDPPPLPSILRRGEWFMGKVLDVYWKWSQVGDTYLGRCIAGLDPDSDTFGILPPHFKLAEEKALQNEHIREAMDLCFGPIIKEWGPKCAIEGILLLLLASIVYHSEFLLSFIAANSAHPFLSIPVLQRIDLLNKLKEMVTIKPAGDVLTPTGVPRHVKMMKKLTEMFSKIDCCMTLMTKINAELPQTISDAINDKAAEAGQVTAQFVMEKLQEHTGSISATIQREMQTNIAQILREMDIQPRQQAVHVVPDHPPECPVDLGGVQQGRFRIYTYREGHRRRRSGSWAVPDDFDFPALKLKAAWMSYLFGFPNNRSIKTDENGAQVLDEEGNMVIIRTPIRPLRFLADDMVPMANSKSKRIRKKYRDDWRPILLLMHDVNRAMIANTPLEKVNHGFLDTTYNLALNSISSRYPELFSGVNASRHQIWVISTWCKEIKRLKRAQ